MKTFISILRGVNVSGQKKILMKDLKELFEKLHFKRVQTYIQSGNVVFESDIEYTNSELAIIIETAIEKEFRFHVPTIIRSREELKTVISLNPFLKDPGIDLKKLHVTFLSEDPAKENAQSIVNNNFSPDQFAINGRNIFLHIPGSYGQTKLSNSFFEKKLKVTATTRNWNTVKKLLEMASD
jgi:uncharacterized protein (DUF1697 family)